VSEVEHIDLRGASIETISSEIGKQLKLHARRQGGITRLVDRSGVSRSTVSRLFGGEVVGIDSLLKVLRALERWDILYLMVVPPNETPIQKLAMQRSKSLPSEYNAPKAGSGIALASPDELKQSLKNKGG
jgi:transcriptional regulator with XRE-family HTH domain